MEILDSFFNSSWVIQLILALGFIILFLGTIVVLTKNRDRTVTTEELHYWINKFKQ